MRVEVLRNYGNIFPSKALRKQVSDYRFMSTAMASMSSLASSQVNKLSAINESLMSNSLRMLATNFSSRHDQTRCTFEWVAEGCTQKPSGRFILGFFGAVKRMEAIVAEFL